MIGIALFPFVSSEVEKRIPSACDTFLDFARNEREKGNPDHTARLPGLIAGIACSSGGRLSAS